MSVIWLFFGIGVLVGDVFGVFLMCLCFVNGQASRREEQREQNR